MSLERLSTFISTGFGILLVACLLTMALDEYYGGQAVSVSDKRHQMIISVDRMFILNRELTQLVRLNAVTGDELYRRLYFQKWREGEAFRDSAINFQAVGLNVQESALLDTVQTMDTIQTDMERQSMARQGHDVKTALSTATYINSEWSFANALNQLRSSVNERLNGEIERARSNAALTGRIRFLMQVFTLVAGLLVFLVILRRRLLLPLVHVTNCIRRLQTGERVGRVEVRHGLAEIVALGDVVDAYVHVNEELRRQHWVKRFLSELTQALQLCTSREAFAGTLQQRLRDGLACRADLLFDASSFVVGAGQVHFSLPLLQEGQQLASLELLFAHHPGPATLKLLDSLPNRLGTLLSLLLQRLNNQQLLNQARLQARQLECQALALEQRQASLEATESWYRGIVEFAPKALLVFDDHSVILANQQSEATFGYAPGQLLGKTYRQLVPESQFDWVESALKRVKANKGLNTLEIVAQRADGSEFPAELRLCLLPSRESQGLCLCVAIRDLSQRKAHERRLLDAHERQQAIIAAAPYGIALVQGGSIIQTNARLDELLGYTPGEQLQRSPLTWLDQVAWGETLTALEASIREKLNRGEIFQQQLQLCRKDCVNFWASVSARAIAPGNLSRGSIWIIEDISTQHAAAHEMQQARQLAEESARIKAEFLANMSHEIRTPMNAIIGMTHLALRTDLSARQRDYLEKVQRSSRHLLGVLDDILDFSKIEAGKLQLELRDFSLAQLLEDALDQVRSPIEEKRLELRLNVGADVPERLSGDPLRLRQILLNYLSNAVKFTERGEIRVEVTLRGANAEQALLCFSVADTGIGLSPGQLQQMFQSFQQADASTTRRFGGTGLGLAIARQLAELMGGRVGARSEPGEGSHFWFEVPLLLAYSDAADGLLIGDTTGDWKVAGGTRILLVEDNELNQQVAVELLQAVGCRVDIASDGQQALERVCAGRYDLVFMDMQMPVLDGLAATRLLRQMPGMERLPVIAMTANARLSDQEACLSAGMNDFVRKPFEPPTLYAALRRWLPPVPVAQACNQPSVADCVDAAFQLEGVDTVGGLRRVLGKHSLYLDLLQHYQRDQHRLLEQLSQALEAGDQQTAQRLAHTCKGVSATIGADTIAQAADALEQALRSGHPAAQLQLHLRALAQPLEALLQQLTEQLPAEIEGLRVAVDRLELQRVCTQLEGLLADFDAQAVPCISRHAQLLRSAFAEGFEPLAAAVKRFDFVEAQGLLKGALCTYEWA